MPEIPQNPKKDLSPDWFVQGALTRIGDIFDRLTGRGWKPSSSLATSGLVERMKVLMERENKEVENGRKFVPHNIKLKMQWDKFSTDAEESLKALENELLIAAVDFINDHRYYTYAPLHVEVKPDYFTTGVKLFVSYDSGDDEAELNVTVQGMNLSDLDIPAESKGSPASRTLTAHFLEQTKKFELVPNRRISVGRTKENDIALDDPSVSKFHASVMLNTDGRIVVADTGSTNGTFVDGERIAYGKAMTVNRSVKFGTIEVAFTVDQPVARPAGLPPTEKFTVGEFQFSKRTETIVPSAVKTEAAISPQPNLTDDRVRHGETETDDPDEKDG
jgi:pSer/pThr/pTyr-binding forkhead associated (FHA) protein